MYFLFSWNGIHDDVAYFVKHNGRLPKKDNDGGNHSFGQLVVRKSTKKEKESKTSARKERRRLDPRNDPAYLEWAQENKAFYLKLKKIRIWFLLSGMLMIISSILFFEQGVKRVFNSLDGTQAGLHVSSHDIFPFTVISYQL